MANQVSDDQQFSQVLNDSNRVFGMGVGTFLIFFFFITIGFVWFFSTACLPTDKIVWRATSVLLFIIVMLILMFAPREGKFTNSGYVPSVYDDSIIPRIAISLIMMIFGIISSVFLIQNYAEPIEVGVFITLTSLILAYVMLCQLNNVEQEHSALWQEDH